MKRGNIITLLLLLVTTRATAAPLFDLHLYPITKGIPAGLNSHMIMVYHQVDDYTWDVLHELSGRAVTDSTFQHINLSGVGETALGLGTAFFRQGNSLRAQGVYLEPDGLHRVTLLDPSIDNSTVNSSLVDMNANHAMTGNYQSGNAKPGIWRQNASGSLDLFPSTSTTALLAESLLADGTVIGIQSSSAATPAITSGSQAQNLGVILPGDGSPAVFIRPLAGQYADAWAGNKTTVVGYSTIAADNTDYHAFSYDRTTRTAVDLGALTPYPNSFASGVSEIGGHTLIVGYSYQDANHLGAGIATVWVDNGPPTALASLSLQDLGGKSLTTAVSNNRGQLAGSYTDTDGSSGIYIADLVSPQEIRGDLNGNGIVDAADVNQVFRYLLGLGTPSSFREWRAICGLLPLGSSLSVSATQVVNILKCWIGSAPVQHILN